MSQGCIPETHRSRLGKQTGQYLSQPTHVAAVFDPAMVQGVAAPTPRRNPFSKGIIVVPPDVLNFSVEMAQGSFPSQPRLWQAPRLGLSLSQTSHDAASLSVDMVQGSVAGDRATKPFTMGTIVIPPDVEVFSIDMVQGMYITDRATKPFTYGSIIYPPEVLVFSVEMAQGSFPISPRIFLAPRLPFSDTQLSHVEAAFSPEMFQGWHADTNRTFKSFTSGSISVPPDINLFSIEMVQGSIPTRPRLFLAPRIPLPVSQLTQVNAAFSIEMVQLTVPSIPRLFRGQRLVLPGLPITIPVIPPVTMAPKLILVNGQMAFHVSGIVYEII